MKTIGAGSIFETQVELEGSRLILTQDNGQQVVVHFDNISDLQEAIEELVEADSEDYDDSMDGDHESALASCGWGTDEDYGYFGDDY